ncbi:MAG TPA: carbohydrate-binding protein [Thermoanaerobaculia bacterium]|jgi:hypothetical protein
MKKPGWYLAVVLLLAMPLFAVQTPYGAVPSLPGTVEAENFDNGNPGEAYSDSTAGNLFGVYRFLDPDVGPIAAGGHHIGALANGEWTEYTVNIPATANFSIDYRYSSNTTLATSFQVYLDNVLLTTRSVTSTGGWENYVTSPSINVGNLTAGNGRILKILFTQGAFNLDWIRFTACVPPSITSQPVSRSVMVKKNASFTVGASGATSYRWYRNGVALNNITNKIQGATSATLTVLGVEEGADGGSYHAVVTNSCGSVQSAAATLVVSCTNAGPVELTNALSAALTNGPEYCVWKDEVRPGFSSYWAPEGSYNIPVLANAIAFLRAPYGLGTGYSWNMDTFWRDYLKRELGDLSPWYFGGKEMFSGDYQKFNLSSVLAVHYHAQKNGKTEIAALARRWLRATWALHSAAAMTQKPATLHANGESLSVTDPWTGPYAALAGERTPWGFWTESNRNIMLGRAIGFPTTGNGWLEFKRIRDAVEQGWATIVNPPSNAYGLTASEATALRDLINNETLPANFVASYLGTGLKTYMTYHIVAWPGVRATLLERSENTNTVPTYGVVSYGANAYFLYPWPYVFQGDLGIRNVCAGTASLNFATGMMYASRPAACNAAPSEATQTIPTTTRLYWITIGTGGTQVR